MAVDAVVDRERMATISTLLEARRFNVENERG